MEAKTVAKAKAQATRQARGTMGKKQRLAISATPSMTVQVLGTDGQPVTAPATNSTVAAPTVGAPAPTVDAPAPSAAGSKPTP